MGGWKKGKGWNSMENSILAAWIRRVRESYFGSWIFDMFQTTGMTTATSGGTSGGGVGGALSLMGCVREASPPPIDHHPLRLGNFQHSVDALPKGQFLFIPFSNFNPETGKFFLLTCQSENFKGYHRSNLVYTDFFSQFLIKKKS